MSQKKCDQQSITETDLILLLSIIHTAQIDKPEEPPAANVTEINSTDTDDAGPTRFPSKVNKH